MRPEDLADDAEAVARVKGTSVNALHRRSQSRDLTLAEYFWLAEQVTGVKLFAKSPATSSATPSDTAATTSTCPWSTAQTTSK
jgi:hypothetical protein